MPLALLKAPLKVFLFQQASGHGKSKRKNARSFDFRVGLTQSLDSSGFFGTCL